MAAPDSSSPADYKLDSTMDQPPESDSRSVKRGTLLEAFGFGAPKTRDIAQDLYHELENMDPEELEAQKNEVRKLIDWRIMPLVR